jgi:predicted ester cyclase
VSARTILGAGLFVLATAACATEPRALPTSAQVCGSPKSEAEANKAIVSRLFVDLWDKKNPDAAVSGILAVDLVNHAAVPEAQGAEGVRTITKKLFAAFPDLTNKPIDVIAEGDRVVVRSIVEGTQTGALEFKDPLPATGKHMKIEQLHVYRIKDGKVVEMWMTMDHLERLKQLGLFPSAKKDGAS